MDADIDLQIENLQKELSSMSKGSIHYAPLMQRIHLLQSQQVMPLQTPQPSSDNPNTIHNWHNKPLGKIWLGVIVIVFGSFVIYLIWHYLGIPLYG